MNTIARVTRNSDYDDIDPPITTAEAKSHMRVEHSDDDTYIGLLVRAATQVIEDETRQILVQATFDFQVDAWPEGDIVIPCVPFVSTSFSMSYYDSNGNATALTSGTDYELDTTSRPGRIWRTPDSTWPSLQADRPRGAVYGSFKAGYATGASDAAEKIPPDLVHAVKFLVAHYYRVREPVELGVSVTEVPLAVRSLIDRNTFYSLAV